MRHRHHHPSQQQQPSTTPTRCQSLELLGTYKPSTDYARNDFQQISTFDQAESNLFYV